MICILTVEESRGVYASPRYSPGEIPHLSKGPALADGDDEADEEEDCVQDDGCVAQNTESPC